MVPGVIPVMEKLNLTFQKDSVDLSAMISSAKSACDALLIAPGSEGVIWKNWIIKVLWASLNTGQTFE